MSVIRAAKMDRYYRRGLITYEEYIMEAELEAFNKIMKWLRIKV
ncbi:hypothetical protein ACDN41_12240 [Priestia aryabhattai]